MRAVLVLLVALLLVGATAFSAVAAAGPKEDIERVDFIHYKGKPAGGGKAGSCFKVLGPVWKAPVDYVINPTNSEGLSESFVNSTIQASAATWDAATSANLFGTATVDSAATPGTLDGKNVIGFGSLPSGTIAVTSLWFNRKTRAMVEADMTFNQGVYPFGDATLNASVMDLQDIATHELGHFAGSLDDIYSTSCTTVTMYGYSDFGETSKRTLEAADIAGLQKNYGA